MSRLAIKSMAKFYKNSYNNRGISRLLKKRKGKDYE